MKTKKMNPTNSTFRRQPTAWACSGALLLALACPSAYAVQDCEFKGQHINTSDGSQTAGKTGMVLCKDRDSGKTEREYELRDGKSIGLSRYFRDGKRVKEFTVTANGPHEGLEREWTVNGQLVQEFTNVNGHIRGLRRQWFDDGRPRKVEWVAGNESGSDRDSDSAAVEYHAGSGQLATLRCGPKPLLAPHVDDAKLCGFNAPSTVNTYSYKGEVRKTSVLVAGVEQKATTFFGMGQPELEEELLQQGTQKRETYYAAEGGKRREKLWDVSGRPALLLREAEFHASGTLIAERNYQLVVADANGKIARQKVWDESGKLVSDDELFEDGSRKAYSR